MAYGSMGYKHLFDGHGSCDEPRWRVCREPEERRRQAAAFVPHCSQEVVWVRKRLNPKIDPRFDVPATRFKVVVPDHRMVPGPPTDSAWIPPLDVPAGLYGARPVAEETAHYESQQNTRCEQLTTLRQMLPSRGIPNSVRPPKWTVNPSEPPAMVGHRQTHFPFLHCQMTAYEIVIKIKIL